MHWLFKKGFLATNKKQFLKEKFGRCATRQIYIYNAEAQRKQNIKAQNSDKL